jgi:hypothetical protein
MEPAFHDMRCRDSGLGQPLRIAPYRAITDARFWTMKEWFIPQKGCEALAVSLIPHRQPLDRALWKPLPFDALRLFQLRQAHADPIGLPHQQLTPSALPFRRFTTQTAEPSGDFQKDRTGLDIRRPVDHQERHFGKRAGHEEVGRPAFWGCPNVHPDGRMTHPCKRQGKRHLASMPRVGMSIKHQISHAIIPSIIHHNGCEEICQWQPIPSISLTPRHWRHNARLHPTTLHAPSSHLYLLEFRETGNPSATQSNTTTCPLAKTG